MSPRRTIIGSRSLWIVIGVLICSSTIGAIVQAATTSEVQCLERASSDRSAALKDAYDRYNEDTGDAADLLKKGQTEALKISDIATRSQELWRITSRYSADVAQANATLGYAVQQAWNDYQSRQSSCGFHGASNAPAYGGYAGWPDYRWPTSSYNPWGAYGGYGLAWPWYHTGYPPNYLSPSGYISYGYNYCPQIVLPTIPAGCGYECSRESNSCPVCEVSCRNVTLDSLRCACPQTYAPVCGSDSRTYTNSCFAQCADVRIVYGGSCAY